VVPAVQVLSAREGSYGDLLQQLPVNAVSDMALHGEQLVAAACFQGRSLSSNAHTVERPFTIVATTWHLGSWKATRLVSPRWVGGRRRGGGRLWVQAV